MTTLPQYPAAVALTGSELVPLWQDGAQRSATANQVLEVGLDLMQEYVGATLKLTYASLASTPGTSDGQVGIVPGQPGNHIDPISGLSVPNIGFYHWVAASTAWQWASDTQAGLAAADAARTLVLSGLAAGFQNLAELTAFTGMQAGDTTLVHGDGAYTYTAGVWARDGDSDGKVAGIQAGIATAASTTALTETNATIKQVGAGTAMEDDGGPKLIELPDGSALALVIYTVGSTGRKLLDVLGYDAARNVLSMMGPRLSGEMTMSGLRDGRDVSGSTVLEGGTLIAPAESSRHAAGIANYMVVDTIDAVMRVPGARRAEKAVARGGVVARGGYLGVSKPTWPTQVRASYTTPQGAYPYIIQPGDANWRPKNKVTHQGIPCGAKSDKYFYVAYFANNGTIGNNAVSDGGLESRNSYVVIRRRPINGGPDTWEDVVQILPSVTDARLADPQIFFKDGRLLVTFPFSSEGTVVYTWCIGTYGVVLETPEATVGRLRFGTIRFLAYGFPYQMFIREGEIWGPIDVWRAGLNYTANAYLAYGKNQFVQGAALYRYVLTGAGAPRVEREIEIPAYATPANETYQETAVAQLNGGNLYVIERTANAGPFEKSYNATTETWTTDVSATARVGQGVSTRCILLNSPSGNIAFVGNQDTVNRIKMGIRISQDGAQTFGTAYVVDERTDQSTAYPGGGVYLDPTTGTYKYYFAWDHGRGGGVGAPADIMFIVLDEATLLAGGYAGIAPATLRETVSSLEYVA